MAYINSEKKQLHDALKKIIKASGLTQNMYARRLGISEATMTNIIKYWNVSEKISVEMWTMIKKHIQEHGTIEGVATANYKKIFKTCEAAYVNKSAEVIIGEGGYGKSFALKKFAFVFERETKGKIRVFYVDASLSPTPLKLLAAIMDEFGCLRDSRKSSRLVQIQNYFQNNDCLLIIDEVSALKSSDVTVLKDILTAARDLAGVVLAGTPYFMRNVSHGKAMDRHLFSELEDRFFSIPVVLEKPKDDDAEAIFKLHDLTSEQIDIVMGRVGDNDTRRFCWKNKPTYRGIANCVQMIKDLDRVPILNLSDLQSI